MLPQLSAAVRVFLCTRPTDLRRGFDALSGLVQECFGQDPLAGSARSSGSKRIFEVVYFAVLFRRRLGTGE